MRILVIAPTFPPASDGLASAAFVQATGLASRGHEVVVATGRLDGMSAEQVISGVRVVRFRAGGRPHLTGVHGEVAQFRAFVRSFRGEVAFCHSWQTWSTELAIPELRRLPTKKVLVSHGFSANSHVGPKGWGYWLAYRPYVWTIVPSILRSLDRLVVLADGARLRGSRDRARFDDHAAAIAAGRPPVSVIPNGADLEAHDSADATFARRHGLEGTRIVLSVGKYHWLKNDRGAVRAFCRARPDNAALVVIGPAENAYLAGLRRMAAAARLPASSRIVFLVGCGRDEILSAYRAASLFLTASRTECFPLVVLDAMASRTAWVSTDVGCVSVLPGGVTARSERDLAAAMARLLDDDALRARLGEEGRRACEARFTWSHVVAEYEALVQRLVRGSQPSDHLASNA